MCLNWNFRTQNVEYNYPKNKRRFVIEICSIDRILYKETFMGKICMKYAPEASPRPLFSFGK